jgi:L-seryl-tRNA(Ser) seleniumtransferase
MSSTNDARRRLPAVDTVVRDPVLEASIELYGRDLVTVQVRRKLDELRERIESSAAGNELAQEDLFRLPEAVAREMRERYGVSLQRVINATGIFLHTNLGRAPLPRPVAHRIAGFLDAYCDLEYRLDRGERGDRNERVDQLLQVATGAEAGILVNNNAAALVLILSALGTGTEVIVSRGELVEIGGSFRIPDILKAAGVVLVEVGTTNRTKRQDYEDAISERTGLLLKVYPSNYRQVGFTAAVEPRELVEIGERSRVPVVVDEGSGMLAAHPAPQLRDHPSLQELMSLGCDIACGSGDKLLGGPQAGLIVGRRDLVDRCHRNPLYRALRPDRCTFAGVEEILRLHLAGSSMPIERLWVDERSHRRRLEALAARIDAEIVPAEAFVGGGAAPERPIAGEALALPGRSDWLAALRQGEPPVVGYIRDGRLVLDLRTVDPEDDPHLERAVKALRTPQESHAG